MSTHIQAIIEKLEQHDKLYILSAELYTLQGLLLAINEMYETNTIIDIVNKSCYKHLHHELVTLVIKAFIHVANNNPDIVNTRPQNLIITLMREKMKQTPFVNKIHKFFAIYKYMVAELGSADVINDMLDAILI